MTTELTKVMQQALEPCPFCGRELDTASVSQGSTFRWRKLDGCCVDGPEVRHDTMAQDQTAAENDSRSRAIKAWNTRAITQRPAAQDTVVRVCPFKDAECGDLPASWCDTCPKRPAAQEVDWRCPACGTHEVAVKLECHNSACRSYASAVTVHEGWKAPQQATPEPVGEPYTLIAMGFGRYEVGAGTNGGLPCVAFGRNGNGDVGTIVTEEPRQMTVDETIAAITFANVEGLNVLQEKMDEVRALYFSDTRPAAAPAPVGVPALWVLTSQLEARETTTQGYLWFTNPQNSSWTALYTRPAAAPDTVPRDAWDALERERDYWRTRARAMIDHAEGTCWYWMGDGEDHLESLVNSLPVVIRADQLRELLARPAAAPAVPEGFDVNALTATGGGHKFPLIVVREKFSQLGEDVFQDEHPVIYGLLSAWLAAAQAKGGGHAG